MPALAVTVLACLIALVPASLIASQNVSRTVAVNNRGAILGTTNVEGVQRVVIWRLAK